MGAFKTVRARPCLTNAAGFYFQSYEEWQHALTVRCRVALTPAYAAGRVRALNDPGDPVTAEFLRCYGADYLRQVIAWLERAQAR